MTWEKREPVSCFVAAVSLTNGPHFTTGCLINELAGEGASEGASVLLVPLSTRGSARCRLLYLLRSGAYSVA